MAKDMDGNPLRVGDQVGFKDDVEQYGRITRISGDMITLAMWNSTEGRDEQRTLYAKRLWKE